MQVLGRSGKPFESCPSFVTGAALCPRTTVATTLLAAAGQWTLEKALGGPLLYHLRSVVSGGLKVGRAA